MGAMKTTLSLALGTTRHGRREMLSTDGNSKAGRATSWCTLGFFRSFTNVSPSNSLPVEFVVAAQASRCLLAKRDETCYELRVLGKVPIALVALPAWYQRFSHQWPNASQTGIKMMPAIEVGNTTRSAVVVSRS